MSPPLITVPGRDDLGRPAPVDLPQVFCLVLWLTCLSVGLLGLKLGYPMPTMRNKTPPPVTVQVAEVQIRNDPLPGEVAAPTPKAQTPAPPVAVTSTPPVLPALALPAPAIAFATPVPGPAQIVDANHADSGPRPRQDASVPAARPTGVEHLTFGVGDGAQPKPDYPREALLAGQQGSVGLRIDVDENGRIVRVRISQPCRWPLLNQAAAKKARESWRFPSGSPRTIQISIRFEIH